MKSIVKVKNPEPLKFFSNVFFTSFFIALFTFPVEAQLVDKISAKVDNQILLKSEVDVAYLQYMSQLPPNENVDHKDLRCQLLESLLINKLMLAKAEIDSVTVEYDVLQAQLEQRMDYFIRMAGGADKLEKIYKKTIDELKDDLRVTLEEQLITQKMQEQIVGGIKVTPGEVKKFFSNIDKDSLPYFSTSVEIGQIVNDPEVGKKEKMEALEMLRSIKARIQDSTDFCRYASQYSEDPGSRKDCGELGFFKKGELVPAYEAAALKLKPNEMSDIVESEYGYHLIQLISRRANEFNTRHILIKPKSSQKDYGYSMNYLDSLRTLIVNDSITFSNAANKFSDDKATKNSGGFFTGKNGSYRISVEDLDPVLFFAIDSMKVGSISKPMVFKKDDGTESVRVLYLKSKIPPHVANLKDDYQEIYTAALEHKKNNALNEWFDKTKGEVYFQIDEEYVDCNILMTP
jgi:peptidyl-prolyl cis-trans isomerase SurA